MEFTVNEAGKQFELLLPDGELAVLEFVREGKKIYLTHTEVPESHQSHGIGQEIVKRALEYIKANDFSLVPLCSFVSWYVDNNAEWHSLLSDGYQM